ncbi:hypothetical protein PSPO01_12022 [Paraphaeosphaeria sporulosa]
MKTASNYLGGYEYIAVHSSASITCAPKVIFGDDWGHPLDLWSAGCTESPDQYELPNRQPPFDTIMLTKDKLIEQMVEEMGHCRIDVRRSRSGESPTMTMMKNTRSKTG